jgi:hypothetical protein
LPGHVHIDTCDRWPPIVPSAHLSSPSQRPTIFQWLLGERAFAWTPLLHPGLRQHFYRPVVELWFAGAVGACGQSSGCYHALSLGLHAVNSTRVYGLGRAWTRRRDFALAGALFFAVQPAYVQAVVWVSAATGLLAACTHQRLRGS